MKEFLFVYRADYKAMPDGTPEEREAIMKTWMDWLGGIAAKGNLADKGNRLGSARKVVKPNSIITDGPYTEIKELIGGYSLIIANSLEEATEIAKDCPILEIGGNVEVREINKM
ncbi:MAG: YciI family protein [Ginsengibacter sp.]